MVGLELEGPGGRTIPPAWKRIFARLLDGIIIITISSIIGWVAGVGGGLTSQVDNSSSDTATTVVAGEPSDASTDTATDTTTTDTTSDGSTGDFVLALLIGLGISILYDPVCTKLKGGTPMKLAFGMNVVQAGTGLPVEWRNVFIRWAIPGLFGLVPFVGTLATLGVIIVSLAFLFTRPLRRAVWDLAADTVVVDA